MGSVSLLHFVWSFNLLHMFSISLMLHQYFSKFYFMTEGYWNFI
jgi:hypothetical protein